MSDEIENLCKRLDKVAMNHTLDIAAEAATTIRRPASELVEARANQPMSGEGPGPDGGANPP